MKLLIAADSIITLDILLREVTSRSWPVGTEARVVSVVEDHEVSLETWREEGYGVAAVRKEMRRRAEQIRAMAIDPLREIGITTDVSILRGNPSFLISFTARDWPADLVFISSHDRGDSGNWVHTGVAKSVVESAPCSVELVRAALEDYSVTGHRNKRVLLATDGSNASITAAKAVAESDLPADTEVKIVSIVDPLTYSLEEMGVFRDKATTRAHRAIGEAVQVLKNSSLRISGEVIAGRIARGIINRAQNWRADLIVVGSHERRGLKRLLFGSVSAAVARRAHCSVRIIRSHTTSKKIVGSSRITTSTHPKASLPARDFAKRQAA